MKKLISINQLCTAVGNMSKAIATFENVAPVSKTIIDKKIEYYANKYCTFWIIIDKHNASVRIQDNNKSLGDHLELEVNNWDGKFYVEF